jgi:hypothetical protein
MGQYKYMPEAPYYWEPRGSVAVTPEMLARLEAARASRRMAFPAQKFYQEGGVGDPCLVTPGKGGCRRSNVSLRLAEQGEDSYGSRSEEVDRH